MDQPMIPYARQSVRDEDVEAVVEVLRSDWLTTGPKVEEFETAFAGSVDTEESVAVSSGTAALHAAMYAAGIGPRDEVIVPAITFVATANAAVYQGATPVFADVQPDTLLVDPDSVQAKITSRTKAIVAVDYAGQPCDYDSLREIADRHGLHLIADACHSLGAEYKGKKTGSLADLTVFSFHPVKHITTGEGGMVATADRELAAQMRKFRNHGISTNHHERSRKETWYYEMEDLGYNYRITDFQCALGLSQLRKLPAQIQTRRAIAKRYDEAFSSCAQIKALAVSPDVSHAYHLYVIRLEPRHSRDRLFLHLRQRGIGANVHYLPVHLHPYYRRRFGCGKGQCPAAERAYEDILSLPMFPSMTDGQIDQVIDAVYEEVKKYAA
ncbi:MAG TPA: UDP-4-amino-4,6-dideoxy-N-acetyl-beta-L-altrosamine transaminase [Candidatus Binatia bacterium]|jgi:perosamine synthetase